MAQTKLAERSWDGRCPKIDEKLEHTTDSLSQPSTVCSCWHSNVRFHILLINLYVYIYLCIYLHNSVSIIVQFATT